MRHPDDPGRDENADRDRAARDEPAPRAPLWQRYRDFLRRRTADDVSDELRFHLEMRVEEAKRLGMHDDDAHAAALERFGPYRDVESEVLDIDRARDRRTARAEWLGDLKQDAVFALRSLRRAPSFAIAATATLAIAIGANAAIFSVVNALLLRPLPYGEPQQLVSMWGQFPGELLYYRQQLRSFTSIAAYRIGTADFDDGSTAEHLDASAVTANLFETLRTPAMLGRTFAPDESDPGKTNVIILSYGLWERRFGRDSTVIGRKVLLNGAPKIVVGVMGPAFAFPNATTAFWTPMLIDRGSNVALWTQGGTNIVARLRRGGGTSVAAARREFLRIVPTLRHLNPIWDPGAAYGPHADLQPLQDATVGRARPLVLLLFGCVLMVLIVACVNVANLLLARATARESELAVRAALGGGRSRLVRQLLTESVVLASIGGVLGIAFGALALRALVASLPADVPRATEIGLSGATIAFTVGLVVLTGIAFGLLPALRATSAKGGGSSVARGGRTHGGVAHLRVSSILIVGEVALAVLLAVGAELLVRSFNEIRQLDPGFRPEHLVTARVTPAPASFRDSSRADALYDEILQRVRALPGAQSVAAVDNLPIARPVYGNAIRIQGQAEDVKHGLPTADHSQLITPEYFTTMRIPLVEGRAFTADDRFGTQPVAIVSRSFARHFWPNERAIGKRIGYPWDSPWLTIVGVVADVRGDSLRDTATMATYVPFAQRVNHDPDMTILVRTSSDPAVIGREVRRIVAEVDRRVPVSEVRTMDDVISRSMTRARFTTTLVTAFALVALVLGAIGIYGVMSYLVSQRAHEMGVRIALGASAGSVLALIVRRAALLAVCGAAIGIVAALVAVRPLRAMLFGVSAGDPVTYLGVPLLFVIVALAASFAPARRATRVSPVRALRST